jgi:type II secretory pathway pseudopilin PulG
VKRKRTRLRGFTLPLVTVLVFCCLSLSAALVATGAVAAKRAQRERQSLEVLVALESATALALQTATPPSAPTPETQIRLNHREIIVRVQLPDAKADLNGDTPAEIGRRLSDGRIAEDLIARVLAARGSGGQLSFKTLIERAAAGPAEEDCLRQLMTTGRWPQRAADSPAQGAAPIAAGGQVEIRASTARDGITEVLWSRMRFADLAPHVWRVHDWRRLRFNTRFECRPVA